MWVRIAGIAQFFVFIFFLRHVRKSFFCLDIVTSPSLEVD